MNFIKQCKFFLFALICGCTTTIDLPMQHVEVASNTGKAAPKILILVDDNLSNSTYSTSQLGTKWIYPLGSVIPEVVKSSLSQYFENVDISKELADDFYDYIITPKIKAFEAKVPPTIFSKTVTSIEMEVSAYRFGDTTRHVYTCTGTHMILSQRDQYVYDEMERRVKNLSAYASGVMIVGPKYEYLAARDGIVAITQCADSLADQVNQIYTHNNRLQPING